MVIPKEVRKRLGLQAGDQLVVEVEKEKMVLRPRPKNCTNYMLGLGKKVWRGIDKGNNGNIKEKNGVGYFCHNRGK